jgi:hypothetical protein
VSCDGVGGSLSHEPDPGYNRLRSNFGATAPKQQAKPGIIRDQKTKPGITIDHPVRSAKPPSPVQIRAAPPKSLRKSRDWVCACVRGRFPIAPKALEFAPRARAAHLAPKSDPCKSLQRAELSGRDLRRGGGSEDLHLQPRAIRGDPALGPRNDRKRLAAHRNVRRRDGDCRPRPRSPRSSVHDAGEEGLVQPARRCRDKHHDGLVDQTVVLPI